MSFRAALLLVAGMAIFGSGTPISKVVGNGFPPLLASELRMLVAAAVLVPLMLIVRRMRGQAWLPQIDGRDWLLLGAIALFGMFAFSILMLYGMQNASGVAGSLVMATLPAVTAAASVVFMHARPTRWNVGAVLLSVAGVAVVGLSGAGAGKDASPNVLLGSTLVFGAVCGEAAYTLLGKRLTADMSAVDIAAIATVLAIPLFAPFAIPAALSFDWAGPDLAAWLALGWWGIGTLSLGTILWYLGMRRATGTTASAFMGAMPLSALVLSYWLLGEDFQAIHLVGAAAVLGAIGLVAWGEHSESKSTG